MQPPAQSTGQQASKPPGKTHQAQAIDVTKSVLFPGSGLLRLGSEKQQC